MNSFFQIVFKTLKFIILIYDNFLISYLIPSRVFNTSGQPSNTINHILINFSISLDVGSHILEAIICFSRWHASQCLYQLYLILIFSNLFVLSLLMKMLINLSATIYCSLGKKKLTIYDKDHCQIDTIHATFLFGLILAFEVRVSTGVSNNKIPCQY